MCNRNLFFPILIIIFLLIVYNTSLAGQLDLSANTSLWWNIYEENENGVLQTRTKEPAADTVSGFNIKQARVSLDYKDSKQHIDARIQIRLEEKASMLDGYISWKPFDLLNLAFGQMKIPATYEVLAADSELDFISRTTLSKILPDWSLLRAPYYSALYGTRSHSRDLGIGVSGKLSTKQKPDLISYFAMLGNGLGANLFIGGREDKQFIYTNKPGDHFYGIRLNVSPFDYIQFGSHYSKNKHDNIIFNDEKTVFDLDRYSWSVDSRLQLCKFNFAFMYGEGKVDDNYFLTSEKDLKYKGYEAKILSWLIPDLMQIGLRYDIYKSKFLENGIINRQKNLTFGVNILPICNMRIQLNYVLKQTDNLAEPDLDDNIFFLNCQYSFKTPFYSK